jgi:secretion/DNA translocation related TadE-like protein
MRDETGAGSVLSLALMGSLVCAMGLMLPVVGLLVVHDRAQTVSDQAALAAADALNGVTAGEPCDLAILAVESVRASVWRCVTVGGDAYVSGTLTYGSLEFGVKSRAGAPDG